MVVPIKRGLLSKAPLKGLGGARAGLELILIRTIWLCLKLGVLEIQALLSGVCGAPCKSPTDPVFGCFGRLGSGLVEAPVSNASRHKQRLC